MFVVKVYDKHWESKNILIDDIQKTPLKSDPILNLVFLGQAQTKSRSIIVAYQDYVCDCVVSKDNSNN